MNEAPLATKQKGETESVSPFFLFGVLFFQFKSDAQQQFQEFRCFFLERFRGLLREGYRFFHG
jgi:hypothetical protein